MRLESFGIDNNSGLKMRELYICCYKKNGAIFFSHGLIRSLGLKCHATVILHRDQDQPDMWFLEFGVSRGFCLYEISKTRLGFSSRAAVNVMFENKELSGSNARFYVTAQPLLFEGRRLYQLYQ